MFSLLKALFFTSGPKYSWKKAILVITLSTTVVLSVAAVGTLIHAGMKKFQAREQAAVVQAIVHTGSQSHAEAGLRFAPLPVGYLTEVLDLSADTPIHLSEFDLSEAEERLLATHVIKSVRLKKMKPNVLLLDYDLREPWAFLEDYTNTALDASGFFFPFAPFYSPRHLPRIYLGEHAPPDPWGGSISSETLALARKLCAHLDGETVERIDLSQAEASTAGRREVIITLKGGIILRLAPKNCIQQLAHYSILKGALLNQSRQRMIIDLRIPEVAYIQRMPHAG